ncbi:MAG: hypothetical protein FJ253_11205 [Phycisphaerae bacterium]|nr:hypothetical protein [Phycisphaerae bacterium]
MSRTSIFSPSVVHPHRARGARRALAAMLAAIATTAVAHGQTKSDSPPPPDGSKKLPIVAPKPPPALPATGGAPVVTEVPGAPEPRVLWDKFIDACGGKDSMRGGGSRRTKGTILVPAVGMKGSIETFAKAPNRMLVKTTMGDFGTMEQCFDGTNAWAIDAMSGPRLLEGQELESFKRDALYEGPFGYLDQARSAKTLGKATFADKECWVVELKETVGGDLTCYLDASEGFLRGMRMIADTQMGPMPVEMQVVEYGTFGSTRIPSKLLTRVMMQEFTSTTDEVTWEEIPDATFEPPPP